MWWSSVPVVRRVGLAVGLVAVALVVAGGAGASAARCAGSATRSPNVGPGDNSLHSVAATSACNAWAVGFYTNSKGTVARTLIEHWNGKAWKVQPSPNLGSATNAPELEAVAAASATHAWVVGDRFNGTAFHAFVERWNGNAWKLQPSPRRGSSYTLAGVAATSATNVWAVGNYDIDHTLIEHFGGRAWKLQPSPDPSPYGNRLAGVAAASPTDAWAVGFNYNKALVRRTLIEHWNGKAWKG
jgi:hypothetical protein